MKGWDGETTRKNDCELFWIVTLLGLAGRFRMSVIIYW